MLAPDLWFAALGPVAVGGVALLPKAQTPDSLARAAIVTALGSFGAAIVCALFVSTDGVLYTPSIGHEGVGFALYLDRLSAAMFCLVSFIGAIVVLYSWNYLEGDPRHGYFTRMLCVTLASVLLLILSGNLFQFTLFWIATSVSLNRLLLFYPERPAAVTAARKKFLASRLGDACLIGALVILHGIFGTLDYSVMFRSVGDWWSNNTDIPSGLGTASLLLVCTGLLKSAQFPLHGWLIEVMETPTPVSALLHAGIINAGGFLVLRFSDLIGLSVPALDVLAVIGGFTALFGSVVMLTQTSIKVSLAYSTIAQMGFMMLECGLGAFSAALLHILAHSLYKAHAFLSSGSVIDIARASWTPSPGGKPHPSRLLISIGAVLVVTFALSRVFGATLTEKPGVFGLGAVLLLGLIHLVANGIDERPNSYVVGRIVLLSVLVGCVFYSLQFGMEYLMQGTLPNTHAARGPFGVALVAAVVLSFAVVTFLQGLVPGKAREPRWQALYAHVANGLYVNTIANRLVVRFWPNPPETRSLLVTETV
jgi:NAD(P)H-quinone oxidoreductase subunit 5